jgi:hypothetical protein
MSTSSHGRTLLIYVHDMLITSDDPQFTEFIKQRLNDKFLVSDLESLCHFLGIEVSSVPEGSCLS